MPSPRPTPHRPDGSTPDKCQTTLEAVLATFPGAKLIAHRRRMAADREAEARAIRARATLRRLAAMTPAEALTAFAKTQSLAPYSRYPRSRAPPSRARVTDTHIPIWIPVPKPDPRPVTTAWNTVPGS